MKRRSMVDKPKILLVDDEQAITANLAPFLERAGFRVNTAGDGEEALRHIADGEPDLVIMDILMPRMDGREALRRLRRSDNWTPVILLTQVGESTERAMALEEGADDYLNKPFHRHRSGVGCGGNTPPQRPAAGGDAGSIDGRPAPVPPAA